MNFYKRYIGDYARDTAHLSLMEHGAYQVLLDTYYATSGQLPVESEELYRIARAMNTAERKAVDKVASQFFTINGDGTRHNKRADEEITSYTTQAETNRRIAVEREAKRKQHEDSTNRDTDGSTNDQPNQSQKEVQKLSSVPDGFSQFWKTWPPGPRKAAKQKCLTLWKRKKLEDKSADILAHVLAMKNTSDWRGGFVPAPAVYLNDERWDGADLAAQEAERKVAY